MTISMHDIQTQLNAHSRKPSPEAQINFWRTVIRSNESHRGTAQYSENIQRNAEAKLHAAEEAYRLEQATEAEQTEQEAAKISAWLDVPVSIGLDRLPELLEAVAMVFMDDGELDGSDTSMRNQSEAAGFGDFGPM